jgi:hypothetical protein
MATLQVIYDASEEIEKIVKIVEEHVDMKKDEHDTFDMIQKMFQTAFNEGRKFQKQLNITSPIKDGLIHKMEI